MLYYSHEENKQNLLQSIYKVGSCFVKNQELRWNAKNAHYIKFKPNYSFKNKNWILEYFKTKGLLKRRKCQYLGVTINKKFQFDIEVNKLYRAWL